MIVFVWQNPTRTVGVFEYGISDPVCVLLIAPDNLLS